MAEAAEDPAARQIPAIAELTATEAAAMMQEGTLSATEYAEALIEVCFANEDLNALSWFDADRALEAARKCDWGRSRGEPCGILAGLPLVVKDNIDTLGFPTSAGTASLRTNYPEHQAPVVIELLREGAYVFAKANMHELAGGGTSSNPEFGAVGNPYDRTRVAGGSSGGTAAAIAARMAPFGLGTDTAGSVRIPSAFCGTVGLRPSTAGARRYAEAGVVPLAAALDTVGPMARRVADVALMHAAITGDAVFAAPLAGVRIGIPRHHYWENLDGEVDRVTRQALGRLAEAGVTLVDVDTRAYLAEADEVFWTLLNAGMRDDLDAYLKKCGVPRQAKAVIDAIASKDTRHLFQLAREAPLTAALVDAARGVRRQRIAQAYGEMFRDHGISAIAFATEPLPAPAIKPGGDTFEDQLDVGGRLVDKVEILIHHTRFTCALGAPGLSLPAGLTMQGLPVGLELDALPGDDAGLLGLGLAVEAVLGRLPPPATPPLVDA